MSLKTELGGTCALCYKPLDPCAENVLIDENILELCTFLIPTLDTYVLHGSPVCERCMAKIHEAYNFKALRFETLKLDVNRIDEPEYDITSRNVLCLICRNVLNRYCCAPLMPLIEENDIKETILYLVSEKELKLIENPQACADCQNIILTVCDILTLLSIYELRSQVFNVDLAESKFKIPECENLNQISIKNEFEPMSISYDCAIPSINNDLEIKTEAMEPVPSTSKDVPEAAAGSGICQVCKCKNEEVDLKMEEDEPSPPPRPPPNNSEDISLPKEFYKIIRYPGCHIYVCLTCGYNTKQQASINNHLVIHSVFEINNIMKCLFCSSTFKDNKDIIEHVKDAHQIPKEILPFKCPFCVHQTNKEKNFVQHLRDHKFSHEIEIYKCEMCSIDTADKCDVEKHSLSHKKSNATDWYSCNWCSFETKYTFYLAKHLKELHKRMCDFCGFVTSDDAVLFEHEKKHKSRFKQLKKERILQLKKEKTKLKKEQMKSEVGKTLERKKELKEEKMAKKRGKKKWKEDMIAHIKEKLKPNKSAKHSNKGNVTESKKTRAIKVIEKGVKKSKKETPKEKVDITPKNKGKIISSKKENLSKKQKTKLQKQKDKLRKNYQCFQCEFVTRNLNDMKTHISYHTLYRCPKCDFTEMKEDSLLRHILKQHTPIKCKICELELNSLAELKSHRKITRHMSYVTQSDEGDLILPK